MLPFGYFARWLVGIKLVILNGQRVEDNRPVVLVGNHQTGLDFAIISRACPGGSLIVAKRELIRIPIFGWFFWIAGNLLIDRSDPKSAKKQLDGASHLLKKYSLNLAIFPEGTRSRTNAILPFKKGAFYLAVSTGLPIIPIVCSSLKGKGIWEKGELSGGHVVVSALEAISTLGVQSHEVDALIERIRNLMIAEFERVTELARAYDERFQKKVDSCCS
jgi:1-acyl-sn-glycerol-3-phosphate acyltransferase